MNDDLVALLCVYNEAPLIEECILSLSGACDRVVLADGRFRHYPGRAVKSNDGTVEIARSVAGDIGLGLDVIDPPAGGWPTEHEKRNALVQHESLELGEMLLVVDGDERLDAQPRILRQLYGDYMVPVQGVDGTPGGHNAVRLFAYRPGLAYRWHFGLFTRANRPVLTPREHVPSGAARILHVHAKRSEARQRADKEWEEWLVPYERSIGAYGPQ